jgi:hypothetical protein
MKMLQNLGVELGQTHWKVTALWLLWEESMQQEGAKGPALLILQLFKSTSKLSTGAMVPIIPTSEWFNFLSGF